MTKAWLPGAWLKYRPHKAGTVPPPLKIRTQKINRFRKFPALHLSNFCQSVLESHPNATA